MKTLVVYYSRTGNTRQLAKSVAAALNADIERVVDLKPRKGILGCIGAAFDALLGRTTRLKKTEKKPSDYDLVVFGTPVWAGTVAPAIRSYILSHQNDFRKVAFFCTAGGQSPGRAFSAMQALLSRKPLCALNIKAKEIIDTSFMGKARAFARKLQHLQ